MGSAPRLAMAAASVALLSTVFTGNTISTASSLRNGATSDHVGSRVVGTPNRVLVKMRIGHSRDGRPIWAYEKGNPRARRTVLILGQMHGDERAGVRTARYLKNHVPVARDTNVWIIPTMNPDGYAANTRRNARDVDLNRNWPTNWVPGDGAGRKALSEPETRAMRRFLIREKPRFIASLHQPFGVVSRSDKNMAYVRRLSRQLGLPIARVQVGDCHGRHCPPTPTMTSWYNTKQPGYCVTVEFPAHPTRRYLTKHAAPGLLHAMRAD